MAHLSSYAFYSDLVQIAYYTHLLGGELRFLYCSRNPEKLLEKGLQQFICGFSQTNSDEM